MDETIRRDNSSDSYNHPASNRGDIDRRDDILLLFRRRERGDAVAHQARTRGALANRLTIARDRQPD